MPLPNSDVAQATQAVLDASNRGELHFGEVVAQLLALAVESYTVDYRSGRSTCFWSNGDTLDIPFEPAGALVGDPFDVAGVRSAIAGAQQGRVMYPAFKALTQAAGCVGYTVWIAARHVSYVGRRGEWHVERFPD